jgi:hypothetical protein
VNTRAAQFSAVWAAGRTIVWSATTMSSSLVIRLYSEGHCETKESPMPSVWVDLVTEDRRPLWPDRLKPC